MQLVTVQDQTVVIYNGGVHDARFSFTDAEQILRELPGAIAQAKGNYREVIKQSIDDMLKSCTGCVEEKRIRGDCPVHQELMRGMGGFVAPITNEEGGVTSAGH